MKLGLRSRLDRALTTRLGAPLLRPLQRGVGAIFMLHRFADPALGVSGHDPDLIARCIRYLRAKGFRVVSALDLILAALDREDISRSVAFTVDDGYADFASVGGPLFHELGAPVTVFVPTGLVDGRGWFWWDRVELGVMRTGRRALAFTVEDRVLDLRFTSAASRTASLDALVRSFKRLPGPRMQEAVSRLLAELAVDLPDHPPPSHAVMDWDTIRAFADRGVTYGPHTVRHTILSRVPVDRAQEEIGRSWRRLEEAVPDGAIPLFCYPNGTPADYTEEHFRVLEEEGLTAAVTAVPGYVYPGMRDPAGSDRFAVPRFSMPATIREFKSIVLGLERLVAAARRVLPGSHGGKP